nr:Rrf2 family transcriptional regulator [Candidatus Gracilibacteria bacterium]
MIKLSNSGSYALKSVLYIANNSPNLIKIKNISLSQDISESLLRRIISDLEKSGILETIRGRDGGVKIAKDIDKISVYDVLNAVGEELGIRDCTKGIKCCNSDTCSTTELLGGLQKGFNSLLKMYTLDKIIKK